jgi:hypothetical protein
LRIQSGEAKGSLNVVVSNQKADGTVPAFDVLDDGNNEVKADRIHHRSPAQVQIDPLKRVFQPLQIGEKFCAQLFRVGAQDISRSDKRKRTSPLCR